MALRSKREEKVEEDEPQISPSTDETRAKPRKSRRAWITLCVAICLTNGILSLLMLRNIEAPFSGRASDFAAFYTAGKIVVEGNRKKLYDLETQASTESRSTPHLGPPLLYYHPAFEALLFAPLAMLSYRKAFLVWDVVNLLVLLLIPLILRKHIRIIGDNLALSTLALICFFPGVVTLLQGQDSILLLLFYALAFAAMRSGHSLRAGLFLALALFKFQFVLPFVLLVALAKRWGLMVGFLCGAAATGVMSLATAGFSGLREFPYFLWNANQNWTAGNISPRVMANLRGVLASIAGAGPGPKLLVLFSSIILLTATVLAIRKSEWRNNSDLPFALMISATMMVSYHLNPHDLTLLALPIALGLNHLATRGANLTARSLMIVSSLLLFSTPVYLLLLSRQKLYLLFWGILAFGAAVANAGTENFGTTATNRSATRI
jgi:hypothetical protein